MNEAAPDVPPLLEQIVLRCLPKEPAARWQSMKEIEAALNTLQRQLDPRAFRPADPHHCVDFCPRPPASASPVVAAVSAPAPVAATSVSAGFGSFY